MPAWKVTPDAHEGKDEKQDTPGRRNPGIEDSDSDDKENDAPRVKIPPPIFKGLPGE